MHAYLQTACTALIDGIGFRESDEAVREVPTLVATTMFRQMMPQRNYERRVQSTISQRETQLATSSMFAKPKPVTTVKREPTDESSDVKTSILGQKRKATSDSVQSGEVDGDGVQITVPQRQKLNMIDFTEMPEVQVKIEQTRTLSKDSKATTISDANTADVRESMQRNIGEATEAVRAQLKQIFAQDARISRSDVAKIARTIVILLLEPISLRISSVVQRPDAELATRERARLLSGEPPTVEEMRAMNRHVLALTVNLFAGCPEFAIDLVKLGSATIYRAVYFLIVFSDVLFLTRVESATTHTMDDFRHNSILEKLVDRAILIERTLCALVRGVDRAYRYSLRNRFLLALDAAMTDVCAMRQPYNMNPTNIGHLQRAKQRLSEMDVM